VKEKNMGSIHTDAKNQFCALASLLGGGAGDFDAATEVLHDITGKRTLADLSDSEAQKFCNAVQNKFGAWKPGADREPLVRSTDGSRKAVLDPAAIYAKFNKRRAGVVLKTPTSKMDEDD
jgi:hypothetical protein